MTEKQIEKLKREKETIMENLKEKDKIIEQLEKDYDYLERGIKDKGHNQLYKVQITQWSQTQSSGRVIMDVVVDDILKAKLLELALQKIFPNFEIKTITKKDIFDDESIDWKHI